MPEVAGDQLEVVVNGSGGDLEIDIRQRPASRLELRRQRPEYYRRSGSAKK